MCYIVYGYVSFTDTAELNTADLDQLRTARCRYTFRSQAAYRTWTSGRPLLFLPSPTGPDRLTAVQATGSVSTNFSGNCPLQG